jgi:hypothetical protein
MAALSMQGTGQGLEEPGFELLTVGAVVDPASGCRDPLACRDRGGVADQDDRLTAAMGLNPGGRQTCGVGLCSRLQAVFL